MGFPIVSDGKEYVCNTEEYGLIPGVGRSPGEGIGYPLQHSCLGIQWTEEYRGLYSMVSQKVRCDLVPKLSLPYIYTGKIYKNIYSYDMYIFPFFPYTKMIESTPGINTRTF